MRTEHLEHVFTHLESPKAHQCLSREHLQQGDEVVSISEVLVQVGDVSLRLHRKEKKKKSPSEVV